jgi:hypothetical protein
MDFLPDGMLYPEDPAALKIPPASERPGATAALPGPGSGRRLEPIEPNSVFLDDGSLRVTDPDALAVPDPNIWRAADPITPVDPISGSGSNWEWDWETGHVRETWMETIQEDQNAWEKIGKSWDWLAGCCWDCRASTKCGSQEPYSQPYQSSVNGGKGWLPASQDHIDDYDIAISVFTGIIALNSIVGRGFVHQDKQKKDTPFGSDAGYHKKEELPLDSTWWAQAFRGCGEIDADSLGELRDSILQGAITGDEEAWGLWHCIYHFKTTRALRRTTGDPNANSLELGEKWEAVEGGLFGLAEGMGRPVFMMLQNAWARKAYWAYEAAQDLLVYNPAGVECADLGAKTWKEIWCCCNQRIREQKSTLEQIESVFGHVLVDSTRLEELRKLFLDTSKGLVKHYGSAYGWLMASGWFRPIYLILREQLEDKVKDGLKRIPSLK